MSIKGKAVGYIAFVVATPMIAVLLSLISLAILNVTNLLLILTTIGFAVVFSNLIIHLILYSKRNGISSVLSLKNVFYYLLYIGISIITCYAIFLVTTTCSTKYGGDPFAIGLAGGSITILVLNTTFLRKFLIKSEKHLKLVG